MRVTSFYEDEKQLADIAAYAPTGLILFAKNAGKISENRGELCSILSFSKSSPIGDILHNS